MNNQLRAHFPILNKTVRGKPLIYLDNASSTQKPQCVIDRISSFYCEENANIHRSVHYLAEVATLAYEAARNTLANFINAKNSQECIFVRGTTEAINVVANGFQVQLKAGDEVLISYMEHHANIVPWQVACQKTGASLKAVPLDPNGDLDLEAFYNLLSPKTKMLALTHVSNTLGTLNNIKPLIKAAHAVGAMVLIDGAQAAPHLTIDVQDLDCDFYAFSGHKVYGPTGIGLLYGKEAALEKLTPYQYGGEMILEVTIEKTIYNQLPYRLEAGTPPIAQAIGFAAAIDFLNSLDRPALIRHEQDLLSYAKKQLSLVPGLKLIGAPKAQLAVIAFSVEGIHPHDLSTALDQEGIATRSGRHCTHPLLNFYGLHSTCRASFGLYNTISEVDALVAGLNKSIDFFK